MMKKKTLIHSRKILNTSQLSVSASNLKDLMLSIFEDLDQAPAKLNRVLHYAQLCILSISNVSDKYNTIQKRLDCCEEIIKYSNILVEAVNEVLQSDIDSCPFKNSSWYKTKAEAWLLIMLEQGLASADFADSMTQELNSSTGSSGAAKPKIWE